MHLGPVKDLSYLKEVFNAWMTRKRSFMNRISLDDVLSVVNQDEGEL